MQGPPSITETLIPTCAAVNKLLETSEARVLCGLSAPYISSGGHNLPEPSTTDASC